MGIVSSLSAQAGMEVQETMAAIGTITAVTQESGNSAARALRALILNIQGNTTSAVDEETGERWDEEDIEAIGMTKRQLRSMLIDEGLYYAGSTLLASYVLGALAVGIGVRMMVSTDWTATFHFTLLPLVICTPILIVFAILIPYICFKNLEKQSIVERLRATD